jgi:hypothetical protein
MKAARWAGGAVIFGCVRMKKLLLDFKKLAYGRHAPSELGRGGREQGE